MKCPSSLRRFGFWLACICLAGGIRCAHGEKPVDLQTMLRGNLRTRIGAILGYPGLPDFGTVRKWALEMEADYGRAQAAAGLVAVAASDNLSGSELYVTRLLGANFLPEFLQALRNQLHDVTDPFVLGRLILLFRNMPPEQTAAALVPYLEDRRVSEKLTGEAVGGGVDPYRVCDVAYNVIQETRLKNPRDLNGMVHDENIADRDRDIATLLAELVHERQLGGTK